MRLTLRTVLAYLDDVLEPNQARELGEKISQSKEATELINKIQAAIRRRRIGAPELAGPGSGPDPNVVSEYLENVLPPDQVVEFERLCRQSDVHLAEVAACHKILTMVVGQPVEVSDSLRDRMYALGTSKSEFPHPAQAQNVQAMTSGIGNNHPKDHTEGIPEYLRPKSRTTQIWTGLVIALMVGVWVFLVASDQSIWEAPESPKIIASHTPPVPSPEEADQNAPDSRKNNSAPGADSTKPQADGPNRKPSENAPAQNGGRPANVSANPPPPPEEIASANTVPGPNINVPVPPAPGDTGNPVVPDTDDTPASETDPEPEPPTPVRLPEVLVTVQTDDGISVATSEKAPTWQVRNQGELAVDETFAVPDPYSAEISIGEDLTVDVMKHSRLQRLPRLEGEMAAVQIDRGRMIFERPEVSIEPVTLGVVIDQQRWAVKFLEPGTRLAVEVDFPQPDGFPPPPVSPGAIGGLAVLSGKVQLETDGHPASEVSEANAWLSLATLRNPQSELQGGAIPMVFLTEEQETPARRQLAKAFEREFGTNVFVSVAPVIHDRRAGVSEMAAKTMALIGHPLELVSALQSEHEETRIVAITELRKWLLSNPQNALQFREEANRYYKSEVDDALERMLWGYSQNDGKSPEISQQLVGLLLDDELAIRELAFFHASKLSGRTYNYHAQLPLVERRAASSRWNEYLEREGSLIPAE
ncbi:hypothetical protein KOR42_12550 [Thalassoglobus neptunius]|uniref:Uncharacterized protein n=1 Tax=Thalassoglobus neptunius TaxID=1938619 RepID=A0A5C5X571_9PLAN|nr:hypothetical protein [Thalassoglobus neptunius]TWT57888.1 hypothetical protein KOR42_12550 [Thalassoglobus neptunius]